MRPAALACAFLMVVAAALPARAELRPLEVPESASWQHAQTGLIVPATLAGLKRGTIQDSGQNEFDVMIQFADARNDVVATLYLFRPSIQSVPLWFDRANAMIKARNIFSTAQVEQAPVSFAPPGTKAASGMRAAYAIASGPYHSTGVAIAPLSDWLVKIRLSARALQADALDQRMVEVFGALRWPSGIGEAPAAIPMAICAAPLSFPKKAKVLKADGAQALLGALGIAAAVEKAVGKNEDDKAAHIYCRDGDPVGSWAVYRLDGATDRYTIAIADAGRSISVAPAFALDDRRTRYSVSLLDLERSDQFSDFDRLPSPAQAIEMVSSGQVVSSTNTKDGGTNIELSPDVIK